MASWVTSSVIPSYAARWRASSSRSEAATPTSRPANGSSSSSSAGLGGEGPGDRDPLRLPAGELARAAAGEVADAEAVEPVPARSASAAARATPRARSPKATLSRAVRCGKSRLVLEHVADAPGRAPAAAASVHDLPSTSTPPVAAAPARPGRAAAWSCRRRSDRSRRPPRRPPASTGPRAARARARRRPGGRCRPVSGRSRGGQPAVAQRGERSPTETTSRIMLSVRATSGSDCSAW